ncbi:MAG: LptA/OstA family protein [Leptospirillia bacterium]
MPPEPLQDRFFRFLAIFVLLPTLAVLLSPGGARAGANKVPAAAPANPGKGKAPTFMVVRSDHMLARNIENEITFSGHVHLVKGTLRLTSDDLVVYLRKAGKGKTLMEETGQGSSSQRVETMVATGHVIIRTPRRTAYAGRAVYVESAHLFVLTEEPVVIQNGDRMSGSRITFFTRMNKSVVQGHSLMLLDSEGKKQAGSPSVSGSPTPSGGAATDGH